MQISWCKTRVLRFRNIKYFKTTITCSRGTSRGGRGVWITCFFLFVWMCGPIFQNTPHLYTWALKIGTHTYTYRYELQPIHILLWGTE